MVHSNALGQIKFPTLSVVKVNVKNRINTTKNARTIFPFRTIEFKVSSTRFLLLVYPPAQNLNEITHPLEQTPRLYNLS